MTETMGLMRRLPWAIFLTIVSFPTAAMAQRLSWNPSLNAGAVYDTNIRSLPAASQDDWYSSLIVNVPVDYQPNGQLTMSARYSNVSEAYRSFSALDNARARSLGQVRLVYAPRERTRFRASGLYTVTNRPGEIYEDAGLELGRQRATSYGGQAGFSQALGAATMLVLDYAYRQSEVASTEDRYNSAGIGLQRRVSRRAQLGANWHFSRRSTETREQYDANVVMLTWNQGLSRRTSLLLSAGARFSDRYVTQPEARATLTWARPSWSVVGSYFHTLSYTPRLSDLAGRLGTTDRVSLTVSHRTRRLRIVLTPSYYWTRNDSREANVWRGRATVTFMAVRWLGLNGSYSFASQEVRTVGDGAPPAADTIRHVARIGILIAPWNRGGGESLP